MQMRKLSLDKKATIVEELKRIDIDPDAYSIFINKANNLTLKFENLSCAQTHILKQTALICGADAAIPKTAYKGGRGKRFPLILFANRRETEKIEQRLREQPWMDPVREELRKALSDSARPTLRIGRKKIVFSRTYIMGVINLTPDSFYTGSRYTDAAIVERVVSDMTAQGADFIDIGAESTRPGSDPVNEEEEMRRLRQILPVVMKHTDLPVSVDTYKSRTAALAIDKGATIINEISGLTFDKKMPKVIARNRASVVIMHMKGKPKTMQRNPQYNDLMSEIQGFLEQRVTYAVESGIDHGCIILDPGLGFGKRLEDNYVIIRRLAELKNLKRPILVGHSRKSFIGKPFKLLPEQRLEGSLGVEALLIRNGASILRVHDVLEAKKVAALIDLIER
jgi:dihydropteroate synthase